MKLLRSRHRQSAWKLSPGVILALTLLVAVGSAPGQASTDAGVPPKLLRAPMIQGAPRDGQILRADTGKWRADTVRRAVYRFQWQLCDAAGAGCADVEGATDGIYAVRHDDVGRTVAVVVTATTSSGSTPATSGATAPVTRAPAGSPTAIDRPAIVGSPVVGATLTIDAGTWTGTEPIRVRYTWRRCTAVGSGCRNLGPNETTYVVRKRDLGHVLRVLVSAQNAVSSASALSDPTSRVTLGGVEPPTPTSEPLISGTARVGRVLRATPGAWHGTTPLMFTYQWRRCQGAGSPDASDCRVVTETTTPAYVLRRTDLGARLRVRVTATNAAGSATSTSNPTEVVAAAPPVRAAPHATRLPSVGGTPQAGATLTVTTGSWTGTAPIAFSYLWLRCGAGGGAPDGSNCTTIPGATATTYALTPSDVGARLRVRVTAANRVGATAVASGPTSAIRAADAAPRNTREPSLSGQATEGQTLATTAGTWTGAGPISLSYQWVRCGADGGRADGSDCAVIAGATTTKYVLSAADVGKRIRARVTARSPGGEQTAASNATSAVQAVASGPPRAMREPAISGATAQGQTLVTTAGTWTGVEPISLSYQWVRCRADGGRPDGSDCAVIAGATTTKYALSAVDVGSRLRVRVTGKNARGTSAVASNATAQIAGTEPTRPPGAIKLPNGRYSIPVTSVSLPVRLVIDGVSFRPNPVRNRRTTLELRVHVADTRGYVVRNALVFARSTPILTTGMSNRPTGQDGWVTLRLLPHADFPLRSGHNVQFFVRARKAGDNLLAGVSTRRLVQVRTAR